MFFAAKMKAAILGTPPFCAHSPMFELNTQTEVPPRPQTTSRSILPGSAKIFVLWYSSRSPKRSTSSARLRARFHSNQRRYHAQVVVGDASGDLHGQPKPADPRARGTFSAGTSSRAAPHHVLQRSRSACRLAPCYLHSSCRDFQHRHELCTRQNLSFAEGRYSCTLAIFPARISAVHPGISSCVC